jgi:hypothetical protein
VGVGVVVGVGVGEGVGVGVGVDVDVCKGETMARRVSSGYTIPASKGEPVVLVPIALHGDTDLLDGAINAPGVDMGEV